MQGRGQPCDARCPELASSRTGMAARLGGARFEDRGDSVVCKAIQRDPEILARIVVGRKAHIASLNVGMRASSNTLSFIVCDSAKQDDSEIRREPSRSRSASGAASCDASIESQDLITAFNGGLFVRTDLSVTRCK
jgi:hypothetical protein